MLFHTGIILNRLFYKCYGYYGLELIDFHLGLFWERQSSYESHHQGDPKITKIVLFGSKVCGKVFSFNNYQLRAFYLPFGGCYCPPFSAHYNQNYFVSCIRTSRSSSHYEDSIQRQNLAIGFNFIQFIEFGDYLFANDFLFLFQLVSINLKFLITLLMPFVIES